MGVTAKGTLDFPPIELGFGTSQPTFATSSTGAATAPSSTATSTPMAQGLGDQTKGNNNTVTRTTVRRCGEMGILTS